MRPGRLLVDGLGIECAKIENDKAIANTHDVDQSPSMASLTRTASANVEGGERESFQATSQMLLVHGAWADGSSWNEVIGPLLSSR